MGDCAKEIRVLVWPVIQGLKYAAPINIRQWPGAMRGLFDLGSGG